MRPARRHRKARREAGFSAVEALVSAAVMSLLMAGLLAVLHPAAVAFSAQPEVSDLQQRLRVAAEAIHKDLLMAGAGTYAIPDAGPLLHHFAPILPHGPGEAGLFRPDAVTVFYVPATAAHASVDRVAAAVSGRDWLVEARPNCGSDRRTSLCGFGVGTRVLLLGRGGARDLATVVGVEGTLLHLQHPSAFSIPAGRASAIAEASVHAYFLKRGQGTGTLTHHDGFLTELPVVDHVVGLEFGYVGEAAPPLLLPDSSFEDPAGPRTTYGPGPPPLGTDDPADAWGAGENCAFAIADEDQVPRLPWLGAAGSRVALSPGMLTDGPWCPDAGAAHRFDADLLRVRVVTVSVRVQAAPSWLRGPAGELFANGGSARPPRHVPDQQIRFDVAPRNMNTGGPR